MEASTSETQEGVGREKSRKEESSGGGGGRLAAELAALEISQVASFCVNDTVTGCIHNPPTLLSCGASTVSGTTEWMLPIFVLSMVSLNHGVQQLLESGPGTNSIGRDSFPFLKQ